MNLMLFGQSHFKNPKRVDATGLRRQLLPPLLLLILCTVLYSLLSSWGSRKTTPPPPKAAETSAPSIEANLAPAADPEPFREAPEALAAAASQDRTADVSEKALTYLFQKLRTQATQRESAPPVLSVRRGDDVWNALIHAPDKHRGQLVEVEGMLVAVEPDPFPLQLDGLDIPNPSGLDRYFSSYLYGNEGKYYRVATFKKSAELKHHDSVRLRAYFCQLYSNDVRMDDGSLEKGTVPVLVGEDYTQLASAVADVSFQAIDLVIFVVLPVIVVAVIVFVQLRRSSGGRRSRRRRPRRLRQEGLGRTDSAANPSASPAVELGTTSEMSQDAAPPDAPAAEENDTPRQE